MRRGEIWRFQRKTRLPLGENSNQRLEAATDHQPRTRVTLVYNPLEQGRDVSVVFKQVD